MDLWQFSSIFKEQTQCLCGFQATFFRTNYVGEKIAGHRRAIIFTIFLAVVLISVVGYALYDTRIKHRGESVSSFMDRQTAEIMKFQRPNRLLIFLFPLIFFVFAFIYKTTLSLMLLLMCLLIGDFGEQLTKIISLVIYGVSIFFALWTCVWVWTQMRRMSPDKPKDNTKLT